MKAGRELDQHIAALMGDHLDDDRVWVSRDGSTYVNVDGGPKPYSTDMSAAWQAVEALRARGLFVQMNDTMAAYRARFFTLESTYQWDAQSGDGTFYSFAPTAPHAICLAALKAVGVEVQR